MNKTDVTPEVQALVEAAKWLRTTAQNGFSLVFPGNGIQENLADKAKKLGIPVVKFERGA